MHGKMRKAALTAAPALALALALAPAIAFAQDGGTTGTPGTGGTFTGTDTTGPDAPLTLGTPTDAQFSGGTGTGSGSTLDETQPLAETGGGELAIGAGALLMATGAGMRVFSARRGRRRLSD